MKITFVLCTTKTVVVRLNRLGEGFSLQSININLDLFSFCEQKIEVLSEDEEDDDDYDRDLVSSDIEQIQSLLEFKVKTGARTHIHQTAAVIVDSWIICNMFFICFSTKKCSSWRMS